MFIEHSSIICSRTCQSAILLHANMTNMANISRTWFRTLRTYVHSNICSRTCQTMHFVHELGMTREGDHDFELVATPIHTHTPLPLRQHKHKLQTCSASPQRQHSIPCTILFGPMAATSDHEIAALPKTIDEHSSNMARTCLEHGMAHAPPLWGHLNALFSHSTVTQIETFHSWKL